MEKLLEALEKLYNEQNNSYVCEGDGKSYFENNEIIDEVRGLCNELLISHEGQCDVNNVDILRRHGYRVFAGEYDWFGWITGCVQKVNDPRILVYG